MQTQEKRTGLGGELDRNAGLVSRYKVILHVSCSSVAGPELWKVAGWGQTTGKAVIMMQQLAVQL